MRTRKDKKRGVVTFLFKGDIQKEANKCFVELKKKEESLVLLKAIFDKAKKEKESCETRIEDLKDFLDLIEKERGVCPVLKGE